MGHAARSREGLSREAGDVVYWAISDREPAGKARLDCELVATVLTFYDPRQDHVARGSSTELKLHKAGRLAAEARRQGGLLTLPDLCFLLGMEVSGLQRAIARSGLFVPSKARSARFALPLTRSAPGLRSMGVRLRGPWHIRSDQPKGTRSADSTGPRRC